MDMQFLKEQAYPYCTGIAEALVGLMSPDENGRLKLALSSSPEIHNNYQEAWMTPNSNFDLALIRWIFEANAEMASVLGNGDEESRWLDLLSKMDDFAVAGDNGALLVSPDEPLMESHRHLSHLMAIHPLGLLHMEGSDRERKIISASLKQIDEYGSKYWCGYSFSWMACMRARVGQAGEALENLRNYMDCTLRNGFHVNGPQTRKSLSNYHNMRAFTLEGNFAASQAVHEMLLQSWGDRIRIFPAVPAGWWDLSFNQLRAEGGFIVSADRRDGRTVSVEITATTDQLLTLKDPFEGQDFESNITLERKGEDLQCRLNEGQTLRMNATEIPR
jgi:alpha-L-fucosidase 2